MIRADFKVDFFGDEIAKALPGASVAAFVEFARHARNRAVQISTEKGIYKTGHNRSSITWIPPDGAFGQREPAKRPEGFTDPRRFARKNNVALASTSGYGGYLELGTRHTAPRPYIRPAITDTLRGLGKEAFADKMMDEIKKQIAKHAAWRASLR